MKKYIFFVGLFMGSFLSYSQVGIGTPMPNSSSQLEIVATNRGVLIPQVGLISSTDTSTITSGNVNSLLVFNTATIADIKPGYYYWYTNKWHRILIDGENSSTPGAVIYNSTTKEFSYVDPLGNLQPIDFKAIVKANETITIQTQNLVTGAITYTNEDGTLSTSQVVSKNANNLLIVGTDGGAMLNPSAIDKPITVSNASIGNTSTVTVNGIVSSGAPIVNTNETTLTGTSLTTTVNGVSSTALDLSPILAGVTTNNLSLVGNTLTSNVNGVSSTSAAVSGVSNASDVNTSTVTVNGITSAGAPIVNTNEISLAGTSLTTTVNGVSSTALDLSPILAGVTTNNNLSLAGNTLTSNVNGVSSTSAAVSGVSNASDINTSTVTVNGITSVGAPIVNTNETTLTGTSLTTTVNGVSSTALDLSPILAGVTTTNNLSLSGNTLTSNVNGVSSTSAAVSGVSNLSSVNSLTTTVNGISGAAVDIINSNTLTSTNGELVSTVNGVASSPAVPVIISVDNGLTAVNGNAQLGGTLIKATTITADPVNTLAISGLEPGVIGTDNVVVADNNGVLKKLSPSVLNNWNLLGNAGTDPTVNFLGTTDLKPLNFRINNTNAGKIDLFSTAIGYQALSSPSAGIAGDAFGTRALRSNTTGNYNLAVGFESLSENTTGSSNTAIGFQSLLSNIGGSNNIALGMSSLVGNTSGSSNTAIGTYAMESNTSGFNNLAFGSTSLLLNTTGAYNVAVGNSSLQSNTTGLLNIGIGYLAGFQLTTGTRNIIIGSETSAGIQVSSNIASNEMNIGNALFGTGINNATIGSAQIGINTQAPTNALHVKPVGTNDPLKVEGLKAGQPSDNLVVVDPTSGVFRTLAQTPLNFWGLSGNASTDPTVNFLGTTDNQPLNFRINSTNAGKIEFFSTAIGFNSLSSISTGITGVAFGTGALRNTTTGDRNTAVGFEALRSNTTGTGNVAIGFQTMLGNTTGSSNIALGVGTLGGNGQANIAIGLAAMQSNVSGANNLAFGSTTLFSNTTGAYNIGLGGAALQSNTTGFQNISIGYSAGRTLTTGTRNIIIGTSTPVGNGLQPSSANASNEMNIGNTLFGTLINGNIGTGSIGINTQAPSKALHVKPVGTDDPLKVEGLNAGLATDNIVVADAAGVLKVVSPSLISLEPWQVQSTTNKATSNTDPIYQMGKVGINTTNLLGTVDPAVWLVVNGSIQTTSITYPDYVFENYYNKTDSSTKNYSFKSLKEIEKFVNENKHLPGVTGIGDLSKNEKGEYIFNVTKLSVEVLEKVEELYLHVIEQQKELEAKDKEILNLKQKSAEMDSRLERLEKLLVQTSSK